MSEEAYTPTAADHRRYSLSNAIQHLKGAGTVEEVIAAAEKFHNWAHGEAAKVTKPKATKAAATPVVPSTPVDTTKSQQPVESAAVDVDVLGDSDGDSFLTEDEPKQTEAAPPAKKVTIDDVRAALLALQQRTDAKTARTVLSKNADGADTLGKIKPEKFQAVINAAVAQKDKIV